MYTTIGFFQGVIKDEHKYLQTYPFSDGYAVEEKGLIVSELDDAIKRQRLRFEKDETLVRIDLVPVNGKTITLTRNK